MQSAYIGKLMELAEQDSRVLHILADSGTGYDEMFRRNFPEQNYNFGISEENMTAAAAGMAAVGRIPFVFTAGAFLAYRSLEFIRDDICFQNLNVKIIGMGSGLSWSSLGPTHHTTEDIAVLRAIPNLMILSPATPRQTSECLQIAYEHTGPVYMRIGMNHEKEFFDDDYRMSACRVDRLKEGSDAAIFVTGSILEEADKAADMLEKDGISTALINVPVIKLFNGMYVLDAAKSAKLLVTVEEHNAYGGLGSIVAEAAAENGLGVKVKRIGIEDVFASGYGTHRQVRAANGLDAESICQKVKRYLADE